jgi:hypothetical protein
MAVRDQDLTTLAALKTALGLTEPSHDAELERLIAVATDRIEDYCGRRFSAGTIVEDLAGHGTYLEPLARVPVVQVLSVAYEGGVLPVTSYEVQSAEGGLLRALGGFVWTAGGEQQGYQIQGQPGSERRLYRVTYDAGYVTPEQSAQMIGTPTLTFSASAKTITRSTGSWIADGFTAPLRATVAGTVSNNGVFKIASMTALVLTLDAGATLVTEGPVASASVGIIRTLPYSLEQVAIDLAVQVFRTTGQRGDIVSERLLSWNASYAQAGSADRGLPPNLASALAPFTRPAHA